MMMYAQQDEKKSCLFCFVFVLFCVCLFLSILESFDNKYHSILFLFSMVKHLPVGAKRII